MDIPNHKLPRGGRPQHERIVVYYVDVDPDVTQDEIMDPLFWQHMSNRLSLGDEVVVRPADYSFRLHAEVVAKDPLGHWIAMRKISYTEGMPFKADAVDRSEYSYGRDPVEGPWRVLHRGVTVASKLPDEAAAISTMEKLRAASRPKKVA